jgi:hypothetical protein
MRTSVAAFFAPREGREEVVAVGVKVAADAAVGREDAGRSRAGVGAVFEWAKSNNAWEAT